MFNSIWLYIFSKKKYVLLFLGELFTFIFHEYAANEMMEYQKASQDKVHKLLETN